MDLTPQALVRDALRELVDPGTRRKGVTYVREARVKSAQVDPLEDGIVITGTVQGTRRKPYFVAVMVSGTDPSRGVSYSANCTCPMETGCKHVAAVLLAFEHQSARTAMVAPASAMAEIAPELPFSAGAPGKGKLAAFDRPAIGSPAGASLAPVAAPLLVPVPASRLQLPPEGPLDPTVALWLRKVEEVAPPVSTGPEDNRYPPHESRRLFYLLRPSEEQVVVDLKVVQVSPSGEQVGSHRLRLLDFISPSHDRACDRPIDLRISRLVRAAVPSAVHVSLHHELVLEGVAGLGILQVMLETGRCHFKSSGKSHPALRLGPPRPARPVWVLDAVGVQRPELVAEPPVRQLLPFAPPWYVDEPTATCGPLEIAMDGLVARAWLNAPPIPPDQTTAVARALQASTAASCLPAPRPIPIAEVAGLKPVPCLRLYSVQVLSYSRSYYSRPKRFEEVPHEKISLADLSFSYGGWTVKHLDRYGNEEFKSGTLRRLIRSKPEELGFLRELEAHGFMMASDAYYGLPSTTPWALTLESADAWSEFVEAGIDGLRGHGWRVEFDPSFGYRLARPESWYADAEDLGKNDWFGVELGVVVEGRKVNLLPILLRFFRANSHQLSTEALEALGADASLPVPLPDGQVLEFPVVRLKKMLGVLLELLEGDPLGNGGKLKVRKVHAAELSGMAEEADFRWLGGTELRDLNERLRTFSGIRPVPKPGGLAAELRPYQQDGLNWLQFLREYDLAGVLADDMGLGKTVQALAHLVAEKESGRADRPSLVVAPTSLMTNWRQEAARFAPGLRVLVLHGLARKRDFARIAEHDLVVTSYPLLPRDQEILQAQPFHCLILDEAQYIKNPKTKYAQVAGQLEARHRLCLTGTPMENHLGELWSLFHFLLPGFLGTDERFNAVFRRPIERGRSEDRRRILAHRVGPFILRRRKEDVVKELPPKTEIVQNVELGESQRDLYESIRLAMHQRVKEEVARKGLNRSHIIILDALLKLRQVCCDPRLVKLPSARKVKGSAKLERLLEMLPEMIEEGRRILLFSQFTSMLALIERELAREKIPYVLLTGQTTDRATPIEQFQEGKVPLFLISLKAGGTGLNLTAADTVIHYDPWWNPAVENQATDRAHRIGQQKRVFVYKLMTVGTVEEKIGELQARKKELVEGLLNEDRRASLKLTSSDLDVLFAPLDAGVGSQEP